MRGSSVCVNQQDTPYSVAHADAPGRGHAHITYGMKTARVTRTCAITLPD